MTVAQAKVILENMNEKERNYIELARKETQDYNEAVNNILARGEVGEGKMIGNKKIKILKIASTLINECKYESLAPDKKEVQRASAELNELLLNWKSIKG